MQGRGATTQPAVLGSSLESLAALLALGAVIRNGINLAGVKSPGRFAYTTYAQPAERPRTW